MEIIGHGFVARHLFSIAHHHPGVVAYASGVSTTAETGDAPFAREAASLYEAVRRCAATGEKLVYFSTASASMYGAAGSNGREDGPVFPQSAYGRHKLAMEAAIASSGVDHLILRLSHLVGYDQPPHQLLPSLIDQISSGFVRIYQGARRDLIDVDDVVAILDDLLDQRVGRTVVNVGSGTSVPIEWVIEYLEERLGRTAERQPVLVGGHSAPLVSIARLQGLVPSLIGPISAPHYYRTVLDNALANLAEPLPGRG